MEAKRKKSSYVPEIGIQKRLCTSVPSSPATSDLFEYDLREEDDEDVEERITTKTGASFTVSPATSDLFEIVSQHGELSPNTSDLFEEPHHSDCIDEMKSSSYMITSYSGCERHLASEDDDIGCALLEDSDEEQSLSSTVDDKEATTGSAVIPFDKPAGRKYKPDIDPSKFTPVEVHSYKCCTQECLRKMDLADILICRKKYSMMSQWNQRQWALDYFWDHTKQNRSVADVAFIARGYQTCKDAWQAVYGISNKRLEEAVRNFTNGLVTYEMENQFHLFGERHKTIVAKSWMKLYFSRIGDKMPDTLAIHLPSYLDNRIIYGFLRDELSALDEKVICYSQFCRIMKLDFPDVSIPKVNRLTKCDICTSLKEEKQKTMDKTLRSYYDNLYKQHNDLQREEREKYYYHRGKAKDAVSSKNYMCIIIDGMDQNKLLIPSLINQTKSYGSAWRLKTHLTGVINHGREVLAFIDVHQWGHDSNFTINILLRALRRMTYIPDVLYLQMDNCWRENKNQFVIIFLAVLVKRKVFKKIKINFLMVGHTHEDIDQFFSRIAGNIAKKNIRTLTELLATVNDAYTPCPHVEFVDVIYDVKTWLREAEGELHNITNPHCFVLKKASNGDVVLKYKNWSRDKEWKPSNLNDEGIVVIESDKVPRGVPECIPPSDEKVDFKRLKDDIPKFYKSRCFEETHKQWWDNFLSDKDGVFKRPEAARWWPLDDIMLTKERQRSPVSTSSDGEEAVNALDVTRPSNSQTEIEKLVSDQLDDIPEVYAGPYKNPRVIATQVNKVSDHLEALKENVFVAVNIKDYKKVPVLGKARSVEETSFVIEYWKGTWRTEWKPWRLQNGEVWTDTLPKTCIVLVDFVLDERNKLPHETYKYLKETYHNL